MTLQKIGIRSGIAAAGLAILLAQGISAADAETEQTTKKKNPKPAQPETLPRMVITATKSETEAWRTASSVTVVDREKIEREQLRMLIDALREVPGLALANRGTPGSQASVFMRGTKTEHTSVLIDGRPVPANLAGAFNLETTTLDNVERIEVLRGPAASLYGGKTIGGVINIITRDGRGLEKPETKVSFEAGRFDTFRESVSTLGAAGDLDWAFEASRFDTEGHRINSRYEQTSASGKLGYQLADSLRFDLDLRSYGAEIGLPGNRFMNDPDDELRTGYFSVSPRLVWDTSERLRQTLTYSYSRFRQTARTPNNAFPNNNRVTVETQFLEYQSEFKPNDRWTLVAGAWLQDQQYRRFNNDPVGPFNPGGFSYDVDQAETNWALFLQSQAEVLTGLNVLIGGRYDAYSDFENAATWRGGLSYRVPVIQTLLHANYGTAFSPPSPQDREPALFGNPNLATPEKSRGYEAGIEQPIAAIDTTFYATYFQNELRDTYQFDLATFTLQPIGRARTRGVELGGAWNPCPAFGVSADYTYLDADDLSNGVRLVRRPRHSLSGNVRIRPCEAVSATLSAVYVMDREDFLPVFPFGQVDAEDYLTLRLAVNWKVCKNVELFGRIENLLGEKYEEVAGFPVPRTAAYGGLRVRF